MTINVKEKMSSVFFINDSFRFENYYPYFEQDVTTTLIFFVLALE